jgi:hypothetical protein
MTHTNAQQEQNNMTYEVHANRKPWRFATETEARAAANDLFAKRGVIVAVTASDKPATHSYAI